MKLKLLGHIYKIKSIVQTIISTNIQIAKAHDRLCDDCSGMTQNTYKIGPNQ